MLGSSRVNEKTISCLKDKEDMSNLSSDFRWILVKALAISHICRQNLHGLTSMVQLKMKMFLEIALKVPDPVSNIENSTNAQAKERYVKRTRTILELRVKKENILMFKEKLQSCRKSICRARSVKISNSYLQ